MGEEQGDRSTPLFVYWIIYQSEQLGEVGVYWERDSKNPCTGREGRVALGNLLRSKADRSSDRAEGKAFWPCFCHRFENTRKAAVFMDRTLA